MFKESLKRKIQMFWLHKSDECIVKGGYKNIMKGLRYLRYSILFTTKQEKEFLANELNKLY